MAGEQEFIESLVKNYYSVNKVAPPPKPEQREFGIGEFGRKISQRHLSFQSGEEFNSFLRESAPLFISYSNACYKFPSRRPMSAKSLIGADIIYEFDADDFRIPCQQNHNWWVCLSKECGATGKGSIDNCTKCGSSVKVHEFFCKQCMDEAKKQVFSLIEFLENDFGFSDGLSINFSGNAGYHVHLRSDKIFSLSREARIELLDYLTGNSLDPRLIGFIQDNKMLLCPKPSSSFGWQKKIAQGLLSLFEGENQELVSSLSGQSQKKVSEFFESRESIVQGISEKGVLHSFPGRPKTNSDFWDSLITYVVEQNSLDIDRQTSVDLHKIIRVPDTIHGGTGLVAKTVSFENLSDFHPFDDAVVFSDKPVKVFIKKVPKIFLAGTSFGPFEEEEVELPEFAAAYLVARGYAFVGGENGN